MSGSPETVPNPKKMSSALKPRFLSVDQ